MDPKLFSQTGQQGFLGNILRSRHYFPFNGNGGWVSRASHKVFSITLNTLQHLRRKLVQAGSTFPRMVALRLLHNCNPQLFHVS